MTWIVDSHCHLSYPGLLEQVDDVIQRARKAGVGRLVTISTTLEAFDRDILPIAQAYPDVFCSAGIHPHHVGVGQSASTEALVARCRDPRVIAVGESGLDYFYDGVDRREESRSFRVHCAAAREAGLPLVVHSRNAEDDTANVLREEGAGHSLTGVMHCFSSGWALAEAALDFGFYISFSGILTFKKSEALRDIARRIPMERLLVETDAPFLAPQPRRGKRNEPAYVTYTAQCLAELKDFSYDALAEQTNANFYRLFARAHAADSASRAV